MWFELLIISDEYVSCCSVYIPCHLLGWCGMRRTSGTRLCVCGDENENRVLVNFTQFQEFFIRTQCLRAQFVEGGEWVL